MNDDIEKNYGINVRAINMITSDLEADLVIKDMKKIIEERNRLLDVVNEEIGMLVEKTKEIDDRYKNIIKQHGLLLNAYLRSVDYVETITKKSYALPSGNIVLKKPTSKINVDKDRLKSWVKANATRFLKVNTQVTESADWAGLKANSIPTGNGYEFVNEDGELVPIDGVSIEQGNEAELVIITEGGIKYAFTETDLSNNPYAPYREGQGEND